MNIEIIFEVCHATLGGTMSFPDAVGKLMGAGVEYYHVDYMRLRKTCYSAEGRTVTVPIAFDGLPPVAPELDAAALRARTFWTASATVSRSASSRVARWRGGVQGYIAFLRGRRVLYFGRNGGQHVEWFPGGEGVIRARFSAIKIRFPPISAALRNVMWTQPVAMQRWLCQLRQLHQIL